MSNAQNFLFSALMFQLIAAVYYKKSEHLFWANSIFCVIVAIGALFVK